MQNNYTEPHPFTDLASGKKILYLATRLYDYTEKLATIKLEEAILAGISDASDYLQIPLTCFPTFMPFRDTVENNQKIANTIKREDRAREIYLDDIKRLERLFALVSYLNDPCKDDGICMEIGFAFAKKVPVLAIVTDFIHYSSISNPEIEFILDPILVRMCNQVLHYKDLPGTKMTFPKDNNYDAMRKAALDFEERLNAANKQLYSLIRDRVKRMAIEPNDFINPLSIESNSPKKPKNGRTIFVDFAGGMYEWSRDYTKRLYGMLTKKGFIVQTGKRHDPNHQSNLHSVERTPPNPYRLGEIDLHAALTSDVLVLSADAVETDSGTAAIQGAAKALNKEVVLYYSGNTQTNARDRAPTMRNLMLLYSANRITTKIDEIPGIIEATL